MNVLAGWHSGGVTTLWRRAGDVEHTEVAWASSAGTPGGTELDELRAAAATWFGVVTPALTG